MDINFDKIKKNNNFFALSSTSRAEENFFASASNLENSLVSKDSPINSSSRMNDYDSNILENNAYHDIPDESLKLEHKISILEKKLVKVNSEATLMSSFADNDRLKENLARKKVIEAELMNLKKKYSELGLSAKISGQIASVIGFTSNQKSSLVSSTKRFFSKKIFSKISKKFNYSNEMKDALGKLSSINSNVDELITMQVPYGETINRYDKLTAYLNKANVIHSQISKNLKDVK